MTERWTDDRLDRFASSVEQYISANQTTFTTLVTRVDGLSLAVTQMADLQLEFGRGLTQMQQGMSLMQQSISQMQESISELRAGQEQQGRVLDYLLKKEQERQNGS